MKKKSDPKIDNIKVNHGDLKYTELKEENNNKNISGKFNSLCYLRRSVRVICHLLIFILSSLLFLYYNIRMSDRYISVFNFSSSNLDSLTVNLSNCKLNLE
jgi:hypothetical protein